MLGGTLAVVTLIAAVTALNLVFDPRWRDFPYPALTMAAIPLWMVTLFNRSKSSANPNAEASFATLLAAAALYILFNEGFANWQSLWLCAAYGLLSVTLWRVQPGTVRWAARTVLGAAQALLPSRLQAAEADPALPACKRSKRSARMGNRSDYRAFSTSLRAKRSNPEPRRAGLDCFVASAPRNDGDLREGSAVPFDDLSRRDWARIAGLLALGMPANISGPAKAAAGGETSSSKFPAGFVWGTATSAYQIEGAVNEDGRGPSIWDRHAHIPGNIADGSNADLASDSYRRYKQDVQLMKALGAKAYRFSIAWPRVFPEGTGKPNPKGLDFYNRLLDELLANGIEPFVTLYHWDLPQPLQDRFGGWRSRETSKAFADYAGYVAGHLSDRVKSFFTINECSRLVHLGHGEGSDAPGLKLPPQELHQVRHHVALGHGLAVQAIRAHARAGTKVGPAENMVICVPAIETPANVRAAELATRETNAGYLTVMLEGKYTDAYLGIGRQRCPEIH